MRRPRHPKRGCRGIGKKKREVYRLVPHPYAGYKAMVKRPSTHYTLSPKRAVVEKKIDIKGVVLEETRLGKLLILLHFEN
jgi:hypothetical protein